MSKVFDWLKNKWNQEKQTVQRSLPTASNFNRNVQSFNRQVVQPVQRAIQPVRIAQAQPRVPQTPPPRPAYTPYTPPKQNVFQKMGFNEYFLPELVNKTKFLGLEPLGNKIAGAIAPLALKPNELQYMSELDPNRTNKAGGLKEYGQIAAGLGNAYLAGRMGGFGKAGLASKSEILNNASKTFSPSNMALANKLRQAGKLAKTGENIYKVGKGAVEGAGYMGSQAFQENKSKEEIIKSMKQGAVFGGGAATLGVGISGAAGKIGEKMALNKAMAWSNPAQRKINEKEVDTAKRQLKMLVPARDRIKADIEVVSKYWQKLGASNPRESKIAEAEIQKLNNEYGQVQQELKQHTDTLRFYNQPQFGERKGAMKNPFMGDVPEISNQPKPGEVVSNGVKPTVQGIVPESKPKANISSVAKPSELPVSNLENGQPTGITSKVMQETPTPQLESNKKLSFDTSKPQNEPKVNDFYNVDNLNISDKAKSTIKTEISNAGEKIAAVTGKKLTNAEVVKTAEKTAGILDKTVSREQTAKKIAENLKLRQKIAATAEKGFKNKKEAEDFVGLFMKDKSAGTDSARTLQARRIMANQNEQEGIDIILNAIYRTNKNADEIIKASKKYDLSNPDELTKFYREFVKPNAGDWIDAIRYNSMLSSPTTHLVNISSNLQGAGLIEPLTKTVTGGLDAIKSALTGKPRQAFAGEGLQYSIGAVKNLGNASKKLWNIMSGKEVSNMQEIHNIPLTQKGTAGRVVENALKVPGRLLQGMDEFFTTLGEAGNMRSLSYREGKGVKVADIGNKAYAGAKKTIFNAPFDPKEEGHLLGAIEYVPKLLAGWKNADNPIVRTVAKFTFPFVKIGSNLLKSGVEYSPFGVGTLWGATNKTEQLAKTIIGTASALGAATLLGQGRLTWAEPVNEKQKNAFRDAGLQPYAVRVGTDKEGKGIWVSYSKLHPAIAFNFALIAALDDSLKNKRLSDNQADTVMQTFAKFGSFTADQSYLRNIGDFMSAAQGSVSGWSKYASNYGQQLIPLRALMGYVERIVDPVQRQVDSDGSILSKQMQYIMAQIPWVANKVPVRTNEMGEPIINQNRGINAISPARVSTENPQGMQNYNQILAESAANKQTEDINKANKKGISLTSDKTGEIEPGIYRLKDGTIKYKGSDGQLQKVNSIDKARLEISKTEFADSGKNFAVYNDKVFRLNADGSVKVDTKIGYDTLLTTQQLENAKTADNLSEWGRLYDIQRKNLITQLEDTNLDELEKGDLQQKLDKLDADAEKYAGYGGFKKPLKGKAPKKLKTVTDVFSGFKPKISLVKPTVKSLKTNVASSGFKRPSSSSKSGNLRLKKGI